MIPTIVMVRVLNPAGAGWPLGDAPLMILPVPSVVWAYHRCYTGVPNPRNVTPTPPLVTE